MPRSNRPKHHKNIRGSAQKQAYGGQRRSPADEETDQFAHLLPPKAPKYIGSYVQNRGC